MQREAKEESKPEEAQRIVAERKSDTAISPIMNEIVLVSSESEDEDRVLVVKSDNDDKDSSSQPVQHKHSLSYDATPATTPIHHQSSLSEDLSSHALVESDTRSEPSNTASILYTCQLLHCVDSSNVSKSSNSPIVGRAASSSHARSHVRFPSERLQRTHCFSAARGAANPSYAQRE